MFRLNWRWNIDMGEAVRRSGRLGEVRSFLGKLYGPELHAKRIDALAGATLGVMAGASLAVAMLGHALAQARGLVTKHAVKQVDRLLSNTGIDVWDSFARWVPHHTSRRQERSFVRQGQGFALDPSGAKPLDLNYMIISWFPKAAGLWWVQGKALALPLCIGQSIGRLVSGGRPARYSGSDGLDRFRS